jgi:long-chain acyl-CoA synthetase
MIITKGLIFQAKNNPDKLAIIDGNHRYTYEQVGERTAKVKAALKSRGVKKGDCVGILMYNSFRYLELLYAITAMGAIAVPLSTRLSLDELDFMMKDSEIKLLFIHREFLQHLPVFREKAPLIQAYILAEDDGEGADFLYEPMIESESANTLTFDDIHEDDIAFLIYTGGTTGRSKGVILSHRNLLSNYFHSLMGKFFIYHGSYLYVNPMYHLAGCSKTIGLTWEGQTHCFLRTFTPKSFLQAVQDYKITDITLVPTMLNMIVNEPAFSTYDLRSIKTLSYGASPMPIELLKKLQKEFPGVQFSQAYGMTEASPVLTMLGPEDHVIDGDEKQEMRLASAGKALAGVDLRVVDDSGNDVAIGQIGEIIARGQNITKGYWKLPEETAAAIRDGWYYTGDMATIDEGHYIYIVDRKKDMVISGGVNIYSVELENVIYSHPSVLEAAVIGVPDEKWGEAVKAFIVTKPSKSVTEQEVFEFMRKSLAGYKVPKSIEFLTELPKSGAGKILKSALRSMYWENTNRKAN